MDPTVVTKKKVALKSGSSRAPSEDPPTDDTLSSLPLPSTPPPPPITDDVTTAEVAAKALNDLASAANTTADPQDSGLSPSPHPLLRKRISSPLTSDLSGLSGLGGGGLVDDADRLEMDDIFPPLTRRDTDKSMASTVSYDEEIAGGFTGLRRRRTNTFSDDEIQNIPRLVHRNLPFKQSRQEIAVVNKTNFKSFKVQRILSQDWYHVFLRQPTWLSLCGLLLFWTIAIIVFALIYQKIDRDNPTVECGLGKVNEPIAFTPAFAFSLETCTTVGYGLPNGSNGFFEPDCIGLQIAIYFQMTSSMLFNAFLFSFVFARLARCQTRGAQVLFSDKAIMEVRDGRWMLHVRIYDFDAAQPLVEAHVRMYCVSWRDYQKQARDLVQPHLLHTMRILQPNDEFGAPLFTSIPANVTHQIDAFSPLAPMKMRKKVKYLPHAGLALREADQVNGSRHGVLCPVCGETFGTMDALKRHVQYLQLVEQKDDFPLIGSHRDVTLVKPKLFKPFLLTEADIREHLRDKEIMVVVEGIEPMVSGTFQALQSYKLSDIVFGGRFEPCMSQANGKIFVDVDKFHTIVPPNDASIHRYSQFNGGHIHRLTASTSYLPEFFKKGKYAKGDAKGGGGDVLDGGTPNGPNTSSHKRNFGGYQKNRMFDAMSIRYAPK